MALIAAEVDAAEDDAAEVDAADVGALEQNPGPSITTAQAAHATRVQVSHFLKLCVFYRILLGSRRQKARPEGFGF